MKKYTHFPNEITGSYHNEKTDWFSVGVVAVIIIAVLLIIGELTGFISWLFNTI